MSMNKRHPYTPMSNDNIRNQLFNNNNRNNTQFNNNYSNNNSTRPQYTESNQSLLENANNELTDQLNDKVNRLKQLTINIGNEIKDSNTFIENDFSLTFDNIQTSLKGTVNKLMHTINTGGSKHMCYLVLFILVIFGILWYIIR